MAEDKKKSPLQSIIDMFSGKKGDKDQSKIEKKLAELWELMQFFTTPGTTKEQDLADVTKVFDEILALAKDGKEKNNPKWDAIRSVDKDIQSGKLNKTDVIKELADKLHNKLITPKAILGKLKDLNVNTTKELPKNTSSLSPKLSSPEKIQTQAVPVNNNKGVQGNRTRG